MILRKGGASAEMVNRNFVPFGSYEQSGNVKEPMEWQVLDVQGSSALLISRYGLDVKPYHPKNENMTWENCMLRNWLNSTFLNAAFTVAEQQAIHLVVVDNGKSQCFSEWRPSGGNNTEDRLFLLSFTEANRYFHVAYNDCNNLHPRACPTAYAMAQGAETNLSYKTLDGASAGWWWLRSPGLDPYRAAGVGVDGSLSYSFLANGGGMVRPAMWVNLESGLF